MEDAPKGLTFGQFKDWAFLAICAGMVSFLISAIYDLDRSVKTLSDRLSEKSGELAVIMEQVREISRRVSELERSRSHD